MKTKVSSTMSRHTSFYPTPQNKIRLEKLIEDADGEKKDDISKNGIINKALDMFFAKKQQYAS